ncbi:MAG TPA: hypothetical protein DHN29_05540, partial [Cytophagales bacterium]|nr:hypothetical protein [Cytophagales bacterium]
MTIQYKSIDELKPVDYNPRQMTKDQAEGLEESLTEFGFVDPIIVNSNEERKNVVIGGHQRLKIAKKIGLKEVPCVFIDLDAEKEKELNLRLNRNVGEWDWDKLANDFDVDLLLDVGFNPEELDIKIDKDIEEDEVPDIPEEPISQPGDLYQLGEHRLLCGDATKAEDVERLMDGEKAELLFTSPPYADQRDYSGGLNLDTKHLAQFFQMPASLYVVNLGMKFSKGEVVNYWDHYIEVAKENGLPFISWNVWDRTGDFFSVGQITQMFAIAHEWLFVFGEKKDLNLTIKNKTKAGKVAKGTNRQKDGSLKYNEVKVRSHRQLGTVLNTTKEKSGIHPAMFPVVLPTEYIQACTQSGDIVSDPFGGSGSTLMAFG